MFKNFLKNCVNVVIYWFFITGAYAAGGMVVHQFDKMNISCGDGKMMLIFATMAIGNAVFLDWVKRIFK